MKIWHNLRYQSLWSFSYIIKLLHCRQTQKNHGISWSPNAQNRLREIARHRPSLWGQTGALSQHPANGRPKERDCYWSSSWLAFFWQSQPHPLLLPLQPAVHSPGVPNQSIDYGNSTNSCAAGSVMNVCSVLLFLHKGVNWPVWALLRFAIKPITNNSQHVESVVQLDTSHTVTSSCW